MASNLIAMASILQAFVTSSFFGLEARGSQRRVDIRGYAEHRGTKAGSLSGALAAAFVLAQKTSLGIIPDEQTVSHPCLVMPRIVFLLLRTLRVQRVLQLSV